MVDALEMIAVRRSVRKYKSDPVSRELLTKIIDVGRLAPTAHNDQAWEFVVVTEASMRRQLAELADYGKFIADAPACILVLSKPTRYFLEDGSAATTTMMLAATALGLGTCWVAGDKKSYASEVVALCGAPADYKLVAMIAVGYPEKIPSPKKRSVDEVLHWDAFRS